MELNELKEYINYNGKLNNEFGKYSKLYSMTTENIYGFLKNYNLQDKKILTVAGSGDQRLNSYLMGSFSVSCFDINPLVLYHLRLKDELIKHVNFEKFIKFFGIYTKKYGNYYKSLDSKIFNELKDYLDEDTYNIFNYFIESNINYKKIYFDFENDLNILSNMNNYLTNDNYDKLRNIIKNKEIDFINSDLISLPNKIKDKKYDMILLSNISDYTHKMFLSNDLKRYRELIDKLTDNLNLYGILQVGYIYSDYSKKLDVSDFSIKKERQKYFPTDLFHTTLVNSYDNINEYDKVITYQKLR